MQAASSINCSCTAPNKAFYIICGCYVQYIYLSLKIGMMPVYTDEGNGPTTALPSIKATSSNIYVATLR